MIKEWLQEYNPRSESEAKAGLREIMQELALAGLQRAGFFERAAFYGGTALRIFYGLDRYSEDIDFSLLKADPDFSLEPYLKSVIEEFESAGMTVSIKEKKKTVQSNIDSAFLKAETLWKELVLDGIISQEHMRAFPGIKIKLEVDRQPPLGFETEEKILLRPFSFYVKCFTLPCLFAGKVHALLFRKWKRRVKGRDWYDFEWYVKKGVPLDLHHFLLRARDTGNWTSETILEDQLIQVLKEKIDAVSPESIREDIVRFIPDDSVISIWSRQYFKDLVDKMKFR